MSTVPTHGSVLGHVCIKVKWRVAKSTLNKEDFNLQGWRCYKGTFFYKGNKLFTLIGSKFRERKKEDCGSRYFFSVDENPLKIRFLRELVDWRQDGFSF